MLFYFKKHLYLEVLAAAVLGGVGLLGIRLLGVPINTNVDWIQVVVWGGGGAFALTLWTLLLQRGYALVRGTEYADALTRALASHFERASPAQILVAFFAAAGEEIFFRGLIQGRWGVVAGALAFMVAHIGKRDIRVIGYWSVFQGLGLGFLYQATDNLLVPMASHGFFDMGAMLYFRWLMAASPARTQGSL
jgi:membrane protease YdiL (CAAX protease family)